MSFKKFITLSFLAVTLGGWSTAIFAQQPQQNNAASTQQPRRERLERRDVARRARRQRALDQINLTDGQRQQMLSIRQTQIQSSNPQRAELRQLMQQWRSGTITPEGKERAKVLRGQMMESRMGVRSQMMAVLTAEQKARLQELRETRRTNHLLLKRRRAALD